MFPAVVGYLTFSMYLESSEKDILNKTLHIYMISMLCKSFMTPYFIIKNIIIFINIVLLLKANITCFDTSRLINMGKINKIIFNKTETLSNNSLTINGYHPYCVGSIKKSKVNILNFSYNQSKELNFRLSNYYQNYLKNNTNNNQEEKITLFLECIMSCNNIDINNFELFGNKLETQLFNDMKWDIKQYEDTNNNNISIKFFHNKNITTNTNYQYYYIINRITDIFPSNYYKLTESTNHTLNKNKNDPKKVSFMNNSNNKLDIQFEDNNVYKLRIFKKFIINESLFSAAIVYNNLTKELRFMIKGMPEEIINKCNKKTIPNDFEKMISFYRKKGFILLVCASKLLDISTYDNNNDDLDNYMDNLTFCGLLTLKNKIKNYACTSIEEIRKYCDDLVIISGDNEFNCLSTGYQSGIIEDKNIFILDLDENNKITIQKISSVYKYNEEDNEYDISNNTTSDQNSRFEINKKKKDNLKGKNTSKNLMYSKTNKILNEHLFKEDKNIKELQQRNFNKKILKSRFQFNFPLNENSEMERITKRQIDRDDFINENIFENNINNIVQHENITPKDSIYNYPKNINNINDSFVNNNLIFMMKYYYQNSYKNYEVINNGTFCISGKLFNYLYQNREREGVKKFMDKIMEKSKIFFNMSSINKNCLVDYYRNNMNNIVCSIGQCENDINSIILSDIGINLKNPNNQNTILCHFYSSSTNIFFIKDIMEIGSLLFENLYLLEYICFMFAMILNSFIISCLIRVYDIVTNELDLLEIEYFTLLILSLLGKSNEEKININKNIKILTIYYIIISIEIACAILGSFYFYINSSALDRMMTPTSNDKEFISMFFVLCSELLINVIFGFNFLLFYKQNPCENSLLLYFSLIYIIYLLLLIFLCSSNMSYDIFNISFFSHNELFIDSFTDRNKIILILSMLVNIFTTTLICLITKLIFRKIMK